MIHIVARLKPVSWFEFCSSCEVPYYVYCSVESKGLRRTYVRLFDRPMNEQLAHVVVRKNHEPGGRWCHVESAFIRNTASYTIQY